MKNISVLVLFICFMSCQHKMTDGITVIDLKSAKSAEIPVSSYFSSVEYIPLESTKESIFKTQAEIFVSDKDIVVIDSRQILLFDRKTGKFKHTVGQFGQGPNEFDNLIGSTYYESSNTILVSKGNQWLEINCETGLSQTNNKPDVSDFMVYSSNSNLNKMYFRSMPPVLHSAKIHDNCYVGYIHNLSGDNPVKLIFYDRNGTILSKIPNYLTFENNENVMIQHPAFFYTSAKSILFKEMFNDTIFSLSEKNASPVYVFDLGGKGRAYSKQDEESNSNVYISINSFFEESDNFFFQYYYQSTPHVGVMNKKNLQVVISKNGYTDDFYNFMHLYPKYKNLSGEAICIISPEKVIEYFKNTTEVHTSLNHLRKVQEDDNPIIAIISPK